MDDILSVHNVTPESIQLFMAECENNTTHIEALPRSVNDDLPKMQKCSSSIVDLEHTRFGPCIQLQGLSKPPCGQNEYHSAIFMDSAVAANGLLLPRMSMLKRENSVDDFLADDFCRTRSLHDFLSNPGLIQASNLISCSKSDTLSSTSGFTRGSSHSSNSTHASPSETGITKSKPSRRASKKYKRPQKPDLSRTSFSEEMQDRELRRRTQNREAQRRFRERGQYRAFQDFTRRLQAAVLSSTPVQPPPSMTFGIATRAPALLPTGAQPLLAPWFV